MKSYFKYAVYLIVLFGYSWSVAGSYDEFFGAIKRDDGRTVLTLLVRGFDPNTLNPKGDHPLVQALREGSPKAAMALLESPQTKVEVRTPQDESPLMLAALKGYADICKKLISMDADVNKPGWAPLHYAATGGHLAVIRILLDNDAYIDAASPNGTTPLMMAAGYGSVDAVQLLLEAGADPLLKNAQGLTAEDFARRVQRDIAAALLAGAVRKLARPVEPQRQP